MDFEITDINVTAATIRFRNKSNEDGRLKKGPFFNGNWINRVIEIIPPQLVEKRYKVKISD